MKARILGGPHGELYRRVKLVSDDEIHLRAALDPEAVIRFDRRGRGVGGALSFEARLHPADLEAILAYDAKHRKAG